MTQLWSHAITSYTTLTVDAWESSVDVANNRSYVSTQMTITGSSYKASGLSAGMTGASDRSSSYWSGSGTVLSGGFWQTHNADGTGSAVVGFWMSTTYGNSLSWSSGTIGLTTIPRASQPSVSNSNMTAGSTYTVYTNRASSSFTHTITYAFGSASGTIGTGVGTSVNWTPPTSLLAQIKSSQSGTGTITCVTYSGSSNIGTKTCSFTLSIPSGSNPTLGTPTITENNAYVKAKRSDITVQSLSSKTVSITASSKYSSTISGVWCDGVQLSNNNGTYTGTVSNRQSGNYVFTVKDSRGLTASTTKGQTFYNYSYPTVYGSVVRKAETSANGTLTVGGTYTNILSNTITMTLSRNGGTATTESPTISDGSINLSKAYTDLNYTETFTFVVKVTDIFNQSASTEIKLGLGKYALWLGKTGIKVSGDGTFGGTVTPSGLDLTGTTITVNGVSFTITIS